MQHTLKLHGERSKIAVHSINSKLNFPLRLPRQQDFGRVMQFSHKPQVLIVGHSFVRQLRDYTRRKGRTPVQYVELLQRANVAFHGIGGRTVQKLLRFDLDRIFSIHPTLVILEIGSNDLVMSRMSPRALAVQVRSLIILLYHAFHVQSVIAFQVLHRRTLLAVNSNYNWRVNAFNFHLQIQLSDLPFALYCPHPRLNGNLSRFLLPDGVHLNNDGLKSLLFDYVMAIRYALRSI